MKTKYTLLAAALFLSATACRKTVSDEHNGAGPSGLSSNRPVMGVDTTHKPVVKDTSTLPPPFPVSIPLSGCNLLPIYGDTIIFPQPTSGSDYIFNVVNSPGTGKYIVWPQGMVYDSLTGAINVTKSETGMQYVVGFIKDGTTDTCLSTLVIGGASYMDSVYVLEDGHTKAEPYFDANIYLPSICSQPGNSCTFDVTGSAAASKVIMDKTTGIIDLQKTLDGVGLIPIGAFGLLPQNQASFTTRIYYKLNDASNQALQHIDVQFQYFYNKSAISAGVLGGILNVVNSLTSGHIISNYANPRPPLIIIVRKGF